MKENLLQLIYHHLFGYKYYTIVHNVRGTWELGIGGLIFKTKKEAIKSLEDNTTLKVFEVVSFRSRNRYVLGQGQTGYTCNFVSGK